MSNQMIKASDEWKEIAGAEDNFIRDLSDESDSFCSFPAETREEKAKLFSVMNNPEHRIGDCINTTINVVDIYCEVVTVKDENGESSKCPRVVLIDEEGKGYQAVSLGIFSAVKKLIKAFGWPTWVEPIPVKVVQVSKGKNKMLTFDVQI